MIWEKSDGRSQSSPCEGEQKTSLRRLKELKIKKEKFKIRMNKTY